MMREIAKYSGCFVCGQENSYGLKARFYFAGDKAITECVAEKRFEGYFNVYHGGITAALLDEVMIKALLAKEILAMTVELTVKFHKAILVGQKVHLEGNLVKRHGRLYVTNGKAMLENGRVVASATGKYLEVRENLKVSLLESLKI